MIRVVLPPHLRILAEVGREIELHVPAPATMRTVVEAIEAQYPMLRGTIRDPVSGQRRPLMRFFAGKRDLSHESPDAPLPNSVVNGAEIFYIIGAIAGG